LNAVSSLEELVAVIVNWRTPELTIRAANALIADGIAATQVVTVDNASGDGSAERLAQSLPECHHIQLVENVGYGSACNAGAKARLGDAYLFVNSDAFVHRPGSVTALIRAFADPKVGIAVPRLLNDDLTLQPSVVPLSRPLAELVRASGLSRLVPNELQPSLGTHWDHDRSRRIQAAIGAVLCVRGAVWRALGGFDERRFMYAEDHDLFWRAYELDWDAWFVAEAEFIHIGSSSAAKQWASPERAELVARNEASMLREHLGPISAAVTLGSMAFGVGIRSIVWRIRGESKKAAEQRAWFRGYITRNRGVRTE
jgi:N-acetylglucosaminyl-diphospho-decaprenol L-rhamnosyltransferase